MENIKTPTWLSKEAKKHFRQIAANYPNPNPLQLHLLSILANEIETYLTCERELQAYANETGKLTIAGQGTTVQHPTIRTQKAALDAICKLTLRLQSEGRQPKDEEDTSTSSLIDEVNELL